MPAADHVGSAKGVGASAPAPGSPKISFAGVSKHYGGVHALDDVGFDVEAGTIHAVIGENGAGKSTLMKILAGAVKPDSGTITLDGEPYDALSPRQAHQRGIGIVYQELSLFPERSVLANLFPNNEATRFGLVSRAGMARRAEPVIREIGLGVDLDGRVGFLPIGEQQLVELSRVLLSEPSVLILDEPNSALSEGETARLFSVLRRLRDSGITMFYVSHRLEEIFSIADSITVLRNGRHVLTAPRSELTIAEAVRGMLGRDERALYPERTGAKRAPGNSTPRLVVAGLAVRPRLKDVSFEAHGGEIVGLAGIQGSGVADLLGALFGTRKAQAGEVQFPDGSRLPGSATVAARRRISLVPADRRRQGLMLEHSIARNVAQVRVGALRSGRLWLGSGDLARSARRQMTALQIKAPSPWTTVHHLSGGNQHKVVLGKWLEIAPDVILLEDPARGVDIGAKQEIFAVIRRLADEGKVVVFHSTEVPELIGMSDRIVGLYRGRVVLDAPVEDVDSRTLLHAINTGESPATDRRPDQ